MATIFRCDRCGYESKVIIHSLRTDSVGGYYAELCKKCLEDFNKWVKAGVRHHNAQE